MQHLQPNVAVRGDLQLCTFLSATSTTFSISLRMSSSAPGLAGETGNDGFLGSDEFSGGVHTPLAVELLHLGGLEQASLTVHLLRELLQGPVHSTVPGLCLIFNSRASSGGSTRDRLPGARNTAPPVGSSHLAAFITVTVTVRITAAAAAVAVATSCSPPMLAATISLRALRVVFVIITSTTAIRVVIVNLASFKLVLRVVVRAHAAQLVSPAESALSSDSVFIEAAASSCAVSVSTGILRVDQSHKGGVRVLRAMLLLAPARRSRAATETLRAAFRDASCSVRDTATHALEGGGLVGTPSVHLRWVQRAGQRSCRWA